ncbi:MAG: hypothetical protein ACR2NX_13525 [Chthoniobacterales bacterium]
MNFIRTGLREIGLKVRRQKTRMALRHEKRLLQRSEIALGREGVAQAVNFAELRSEIVALKKLEQEQKEVAVRITQIEEGLKQIETQRQQNGAEQNQALTALEDEKKPIAQSRNEARAASDLCDRELSGVDRRLQENDVADRELLAALSALQTQNPPPADADAQRERMSSKRAQLPTEREEISRARTGSAEACRLAKEKLSEQQAKLDAIDKKIAGIRSDFEARDRALNENSRAQQEALKEARAQHQTVEQRKDPAYLNIGRHLATQNIAPPNAPHLLDDVNRRRTAVDRHSQHKEELAILSGQIDKQELRKFYFSVVSVIVLLAIILPLVFKTPPKREWLPQDTQAILSINTQALQRDEWPKRWEKNQPDEWHALWSGLVATAQLTPAFNLPRDGARVTRGLAIAHGSRVREFTLLQAKGDVSSILRSVEKDPAFQRQGVSGLSVWSRPNFSLARVGPETLAVGSQPEVEELVQVRLGIKQDLKITGHLLDRFSALDQGTAVRLISSDPSAWSRFFEPVFTNELLAAAQILGFGLSLDDPIKGRLMLKMESAQAAQKMAQQMKDEPQRWLRLEQSDLLLYAQPPEISAQDTDVEVRFTVPENSARLLLQRIAKTSATPAVAGN